MIKLMFEKRYFVTDDDNIPLKDQPENGYTQIGAIERAQREAQRSADLFNLRIQDTVKWYHIMDDKCNMCPELDNCI